MKDPGLDQILGEYVKEGQCYFIPYLLDLFNYLFKNGLFPDPWNIGIILPLHMSCDKTKPDNYRGITLMNVLSKLYTPIINNRLTIWANSFKKISEEQAGFREGNSTSNNIFVLNALIDKHLSKHKGRFYVAFVDFKKVFDSVDTKYLSYLLEHKGPKGNMFNAIKSVCEKVRIP